MSSLVVLQPSPEVKRAPAGGSYFIQTWGCQMNEEDSEQLSLALEQIGLRQASSPREAQVILLNTCSVRKKPEDKAFSLLGELHALKVARPSTVIGVCGCMAQIRAEEIRRRAPHVDFVVGTAHVAEVAGLVEQALQSRRFQTRLSLPERKGSTVDAVPARVAGRTGKVKAFLPVQYGCDKHCAFCIVPMTRGRERSRPSGEVLREAGQLAALGTKEVTLLGQTVNSYGRNRPEGRVPFSELLWRLSEVPGLERIRFTSPYPRDFSDDLVEAIRDCPAVMEHVHLPAQAGSDSLLKRMKRAYTVEGLLDIVRRLREAVPHIAITTDLIVGFPGETDEEFEGTLELVRAVRFDGAFMFRYSPRPGTPAACMDPVPAEDAASRLQTLIALQNQITSEINASLVGKRFEVLVEGRSPKNKTMLQGYTREFKMAHFPGSSDLIGRLVQIEARDSALWGLRGDIVAEVS